MSGPQIYDLILFLNFIYMVILPLVTHLFVHHLTVFTHRQFQWSRGVGETSKRQNKQGASLISPNIELKVLFRQALTLQRDL